MPAEEIRDFADHFADLARAPIATDVVETLADIWVDESQTVMGRDTNQLYNRTKVETVSGSATTATATVVADTPYAGYHNYGNRWTAPNRFWDAGLEEAERQAGGQVAARVSTSIERVLVSGGVWNPVRQ